MMTEPGSEAAQSQVSLRVLQPQWQNGMSITTKKKAVSEWSQNCKAAVLQLWLKHPCYQVDSVRECGRNSLTGVTECLFEHNA